MGEDQYTVRVTSVVTVNGVVVDAVAADPRRVAISFSLPNALGGSSAVPKGWGGTVPQIPISTSGYLEFTYSHWGPLVAGAWGIISTAAGSTVYVVELLALGR